MKVVSVLMVCLLGEGKKIFFFSITGPAFNSFFYPFEAFSHQIQSNEIDTLENSGKFLSRLNSFFQPERDVKFLLYTRRNRLVGQRVFLGDSESLLDSNFNISRPSR